MIKCVIFDMDGLMFDTERLAIEAWDKICEQKGYTNVRDTLVETLGLNIFETKRVFIERYGDTFDFEAMVAHEKEYIFNHIESYGVPVKAGLLELLDYLRHSGRRMAVATSSKRDRVEHYLNKAGVEEYFDAVVCGDMIKNSKPEPDIYLKAAELLCERGDACMVLEDSYAGIKAAFRAGMRPVMVPDLVPPTGEIYHMLYATANSLADVIGLIESNQVNPAFPQVYQSNP